MAAMESQVATGMSEKSVIDPPIVGFPSRFLGKPAHEQSPIAPIAHFRSWFYCLVSMVVMAKPAHRGSTETQMCASWWLLAGSTGPRSTASRSFWNSTPTWARRTGSTIVASADRPGKSCPIKHPVFMSSAYPVGSSLCGKTVSPA